MKTIHWLIAFLIILTACKDKKEQSPAVNQARITQQLGKTEVKTTNAKRDRFEMELISNGKAYARKKAIITFEINDLIDKIYVKNGDRIQAGSTIASINTYNSLQQLNDAQLNMEKSKLELRNRLMGEGINSLEDTTQLPPARLHTIMLQTGYTSALNSYKKALHDYNSVHVKAPFSGIIADLEAKEYNQSSAYKSLCTLIDDSDMEIIFNILETEIKNIHPGMDVEVTPFADNTNTLYGKIVEVNPKIDENGMVKIKAIIPNKKAILVDGMNVNILIKRQIEDKLIVPKSAVLPRQGRKVVFVHQNGKAIWKYVTTGVENSKEISIESGLKEGEEVIYENNLGLAHESEITIIE